MIQEIEQKRVECNRLMRNRNKRRISKFLKTPEMLEQEAQQAKWKSSKVGSNVLKVVKYPFYRCPGAGGAVPGPGGLSVPHQQVQSEAGAQHSNREELNIYVVKWVPSDYYEISTSFIEMIHKNCQGVNI